MATDREHLLRVFGECGADDVLRVATIALGLGRVIDARVTEHVYQAPVVTGGDQLAVRTD